MSTGKSRVLTKVLLFAASLPAFAASGRGGELQFDARSREPIPGAPGQYRVVSNKLNWAPDFMGSAVLKADFPVSGGNVFGSLETFWESERGGGYSALPWAMLPSFNEWNLRVGYQSENNWTVTGYVENLTDELNYAGSQVNSGITPDWLVGPNRPRTAGIRFGYYFD
jgi:iron complex outermembrane receptor protein